MAVMADSNADRRPPERDPNLEPQARNSPASAVCYIDLPEAHPHSTQNTTSKDYETAPSGDNDFEHAEGDSTPRSEVPSVPSVQSLQSLPASFKANILHQQNQGLAAEPDYFSPQPLRLYSSNIAQSTPASNDPSPTASNNASTSSIDRPESGPRDKKLSSSPAPTAYLDRPLFPPRDLSSTSTASVATVRANSVDPILYTPPSRPLRDGPVYPNQSYAALQYQQYPSSNMPPILRSRSSHPAHFSGHSISGLSSFDLNTDLPHHRDIMESGSRTVGNSPASSPGLFDPTSSPARKSKQPLDSSLYYSTHYSTPWLHHTHRQAPKETHVADVDVDPVSGRKLVNQYEFIDELGRGVHGKVKLGRNLLTGGFVAIKIVDRYSKRRRLGKNTSHEDKIKREIAILKKARHPNIVSLLEVIDDPAKKKVYIVLEHVELGEVKWRTEGAKEICLVEWRRFRRESKGIFDNESEVLEDERILKAAHQKLERQQRRKAREAQQRRLIPDENAPWSFEHGGESDDEYSEASRSSRASNRGEERPPSRLQFVEHQDDICGHEDNMETAFRSATPTTHNRHGDANLTTELEGTMYGAYDTELYRGRTPSVTGSNSSNPIDGDDEIPEHFLHVPLMTIQGAREAFRDTVLGLEYLHYQGVIHRDIKPANLLQTKEHRIKISDFGVSYLGRPTVEDSTGEQSESDMQDIDEALELAKTVGTPAFYAPELCRTETDIDTPRIDGKIDVWALGVTLYCLIYGRVPFHDHNTFVLMRIISDTEPYIPSYRLKAVAERGNSRPNSHGRSYEHMTSSKRSAHDLEYEEVDEHLRDLLHRLLTKDPKQRISIKEIKRHPWLAQDIENFNSWVEETDPGRSALGRKIEVSRDDVEKAVIPINFIDRVRSGVKKTYESITKSLTRGASRRRAQSSATDLDGQASISAHSSSSTISQEGRRSSLAPPSTSLLEALSRSREAEHPLSQSITAHEGKDPLRYLDKQSSRTASPAHNFEGHDQATALPSLFRPQPPDRSYSAISSASSVRTVRQADVHGRDRAMSPIVPSALPGTPTALDSPSGSNLGGLFGGMTRTVVNKMKSRELLKPSRDHNHLRTKSIDRLVGGDDDAHGVPSLAISPTVVTGQVDQPEALQNLSPSVHRGVSPSLSDTRSPDPTERASSRQSSVSSMSSRLHKTWATQHELETGPSLDIPLNLNRETSEARFSRAKDEFVRRRVREENLNRERVPSGSRSRPTSALVSVACPPSPDDEAFYQRQKIEDYLYHQQASSDTSPVSHPINIRTGPTRVLNSSSSEDQFTPMSQSTSNPSIPSVASANSSAPDDYMQMKEPVGIVTTASADSIRFNQFDAPVDDPAGYDGDHAVESEEDDESDEEDFIVMGRKKRPEPAPRSESISNGELARSTIRKEITSRRRSARSGSGGTVKKIPPPGVNGDEKTPEPEAH